MSIGITHGATNATRLHNLCFELEASSGGGGRAASRRRVVCHPSFEKADDGKDEFHVLKHL